MLKKNKKKSSLKGFKKKVTFKSYKDTQDITVEELRMKLKSIRS